MLTKLDASQDNLARHEIKFLEAIRKFGWFATHVMADGELPEFSYTTAFWITSNIPEVITFSLRKDIAHDTLSTIFDEVKKGRELPTARRVSHILVECDIWLMPIAKTHYEEHLGWSRWFYGGDDFPCWQLVWPDRNNLLPWQDGFDSEMIGDQPDLSDGGWGGAALHRVN